MKIIFDSEEEKEDFFNKIQYAEDQDVTFCFTKHCPKNEDGTYMSCVECFKKYCIINVK